jgi:hypothetical protein
MANSMCVNTLISTNKKKHFLFLQLPFFRFKVIEASLNYKLKPSELSYRPLNGGPRYHVHCVYLGIVTDAVTAKLVEVRHSPPPQVCHAWEHNVESMVSKLFIFGT